MKMICYNNKLSIISVLVEANVNTRKENYNNHNSSNEVEDWMLKCIFYDKSTHDGGVLTKKQGEYI